MMKRVIFFLLLMSGSLYGQGNQFTVSGVVTDCETKLPLTDIDLKIICADGQTIETQSDTNGHYQILVKFAKPSLSCVLIFNWQPMSVFAQWTEEKKKFSLCNADTCLSHVIENFCIMNMGKVQAISFPIILFKENSFDFFSRKEKEKIEEMIRIMNDHPSFVIRIEGYSSSLENDASELALKRAEKILTLLVKKGIEKSRLETLNVITKNLEPIIDIHDKRVVFSIINKNYVSPIAPREIRK